ncbi:unnamed protein product [Allacma fusca]|uniref:Dienelactone hydrolase domain-containing protein n=1 Tax=Allacma fusca TaxID=39272 RepID=A0A8J2P237_9HEXA|nr:unnamed protein product [Allacma fusca]
MSFSEDCCSMPAVSSDYKPVGRTFKIDDLEVYETQDTTSNKVLICAYDIFGVHPNIQQVADILAKAGYRIVVPDFLRGHNFTYLVRQVIRNFIQTHGNWNKSVKADILKVLKYYQEQQNIQTFGIFGFCWGARIAIDVSREIPDVKAAAIIHPSMFKTDDANGVKIPMLLVPSKGETDMIPFYEILKKNLVYSELRISRDAKMNEPGIGITGLARVVRLHEHYISTPLFLQSRSSLFLLSSNLSLNKKKPDIISLKR